MSDEEQPGWAKWLERILAMLVPLGVAAIGAAAGRRSPSPAPEPEEDPFEKADSRIDEELRERESRVTPPASVAPVEHFARAGSMADAEEKPKAP